MRENKEEAGKAGRAIRSCCKSDPEGERRVDKSPLGKSQAKLGSQEQVSQRGSLPHSVTGQGD